VGVSGVGAASARMILSALTPAELRAVISGSDVRRLKSVKGIGIKTAERIIVDLRDKIKGDASTLIEQAQQAPAPFDEALEGTGDPRIRAAGKSEGSDEAVRERSGHDRGKAP